MRSHAPRSPADRTPAPSVFQAKAGPPPRGPAPAGPAIEAAMAGFSFAHVPVHGPSAPAPGQAGLPAMLKTGVERLSGFAMDDVRVHRDSPEPAKLGALAYTQGRDIHLGPGQEQHLPHEVWHVVQQKQGRVEATTQMKGIGLSLSSSLELEADLMGSKANRLTPPSASIGRNASSPIPAIPKAINGSRTVIQPKLSILNPANPDEVYTSYTQKLDRIIRSIAKDYFYTSDTINQWFNDDRLRVFLNVSEAVNEIENLYVPSSSAMEYSKGLDINSSNKGLPTDDTSTKVAILRSFEFKMSLANVVRPYLADYKDGADAVRTNIMDRVYAHASKVLESGNCDEFSEIVYWKLMSSTKGQWVSTAHLQPTPPYDHKFVVLSKDEIIAGSDTPVPADTTVVDAWWNYNIVPFSAYLNMKNHYRAMLARANVDVDKGARTIGYDVMNEEIASAVEAATDQLAKSLAFKMKLFAPKAPR